MCWSAHLFVNMMQDCKDMGTKDNCLFFPNGMTFTLHAILGYSWYSTSYTCDNLKWTTWSKNEYFDQNWSSTCKSYDLGQAASLTWSCRSGITVLALQQSCNAHCWPPTVGDWGPQLASQVWPGKGHRNNLKCSKSGLKVFSCYAAAMMFAVR